MIARRAPARERVADRAEHDVARVDEPAADHDDLRVEQVDEVGDAERGPPAELAEHLERVRRRLRSRHAVTCSPRTASGSPPASSTNRLALPRLRRLARQPAEPAARREPLPAAAPPAWARRAVRIDDHVTGLAAETVRARVAARRRVTTPPPMPVPSVTMNASTAPFAAPSRTSAHVAHVASLSTATGRPSRACSSSRIDRSTIARQVRAHRQPAVAVDEPGHADAHGLDVARARAHLGDDADHRVEQRLEPCRVSDGAPRCRSRRPDLVHRDRRGSSCRRRRRPRTAP